MLGRVWNGFKKIAKKVCNSAKKITSKVLNFVKNSSSKVWNSFTGKSYIDEADSILDEAKIYYEKAESEYKAAVETMSAEIENKISHINVCKQEIYNIHFKRFISIASRLHNVTVKGVPFKELFEESVLEVQNLQSVRERNQIITIDFDNMSVWQTAGMILTLGFGTRKKAKTALEDAKQERHRVNEEIEKMNAQKTKLKVINESIDLVMEYFDTLISSYSSLLNRFEYGIQTQRVKQMANAENVLSLKLNFKQIPIVHIEEFQALFNLSVVLKQMSSLGYLNESGEVINQDMNKSSAIIQTAKTAALCA